MRRLIVAMVCFVLVTSAVGQEKKVLATASMIQDMAQQIVGDLYQVDCIVPIGGDPHLYDPVPNDARRAAQADLILKNGLTFEGWLDELIDNSGTQALQVLVTDGVQSIESLTYQNSADPHAWMDVANAMIYAENIYHALVEIDPDRKTVYEANYKTYSAELQELEDYIIAQVATVPKMNRVLITSHDAFQYYGRKYGLDLEAILGTSTDAQEQTSDIMRVNKVIRERKVPAVFIESTVNPKMLQQIANDNDVIIGGSLYADSIGDKDSPAPTYIDMMRYNTDVIVKALSGKLSDTTDTAEADPASSNKLWWIIGAGAMLALLLLVGKLGKS